MATSLGLCAKLNLEDICQDEDIPVRTRGDLECCEDTTPDLDTMYTIEYNDAYIDAFFDD